MNSFIGEFHTMIVGKWCLTCGTWPSHWRWNTGYQFVRAVTKVTAIEKRERSTLVAKSYRVKSRGQGGITNQADILWFNPIKERSKRESTPNMRAIFQAVTKKLINKLNSWAGLKYCLHRKRIPNFLEVDLAIWTIWSLQDELEDIWRPKMLIESRGKISLSSKRMG